MSKKWDDIEGEAAKKALVEWVERDFFFFVEEEIKYNWDALMSFCALINENNEDALFSWGSHSG